MKMTTKKSLLSLFLCLVLIAAMALLTTGCNDNPDPVTPTEPSSVAATVVGTGNTVFDFSVITLEGEETKFQVHTDKQTVGDALLELNLIAGEPGDYGLYVKTVNGITADYDTTGTYWAFYENGEYATSGVDSTTIVPGTHYAFQIAK